MRLWLACTLKTVLALAPPVIDSKGTSAAVVGRRPLFRSCAAASVFLAASQAQARNLPESTGATGDARGSVAALVPIVSLESALLAATAAVSARTLDSAAKALNASPASERDFKRVFDEYSADVSYKQRYMDSNAFVVCPTRRLATRAPSPEPRANGERERPRFAQWRASAFVDYTKGYDGPGRKSIEDDPAAERQTKQFGYRNDVWTNVDDARAEVKYLLTDGKGESTKDLELMLQRAGVALTSYIELAPPADIAEARASAASRK